MRIRRDRLIQLLPWRRDRSASTRSDAVEQKRRAILADIAANRVGFADVVRLRHWQTLPAPADARWRQLGEQLFDKALDSFAQHHADGRIDVAVFGDGGAGVYLTESGEFKQMVIGHAVQFDWSEAQRLLNRVDAVAEQAREWWGPPARAAGHADAQLRPHLERAYSLTTRIFSTLNREATARHAASTSREHPLSKRYHANLSVIAPEVRRAELLLALAAQRNAQQRYARGMLWGATAMAIACAALALLFGLCGVPAWYAVAFPAGGIGALVSVLQRMTAGSLELDFHAGREMLTAYGAVRPLVGGIFGMAVLVLLSGGLLPAIAVSESTPLPFYAGVGFLAGFNERFAQDMLAGSARRLVKQVSHDTEAPPTPAVAAEPAT